MKTNILIYFNVLFSLFYACSSTACQSQLSARPQLIDNQCFDFFYTKECQTAYLSVECDQAGLSKVVKKDTALGINMGYYLLPDCWSSSKNGLQGPDSTTVTDYPIISKPQLQADFGATELLGYQAIVDECIKEDILKELLKNKSRITHINPNEAIKERYQKNFSILFPCSAPPAHFNIKVIEHIDKKGNPGLSVLYFMVFKSKYGNVLHYFKSELTAKAENYEQDKKDYLYALAQIEYFPEYVQHVQQIQRESTQDVWFQYNNQLLANLTHQYWNIPEYPENGKYRPWKSNRFGAHDEYLEQFSDEDSYYDPAIDSTYNYSNWREMSIDEKKN